MKAFLENNINDPVFKDSETFELLKSGNTENVPGFESEQTRFILQYLKPETIEELLIVFHIDRPGILDYGFNFLFWLGQMKNHPDPVHYLFLKRNSSQSEDFRYSKDSIHYEHPLLNKHLKPSWGFLLFKEQFASIINDVSGISLEEADIIRKNLGKKHKQKIADSLNLFRSGCENNPLFIEGCSIIKRDPSTVINELWFFMNKCNDYRPGTRSIILQNVLRNYKIAYLTVHKIL